MTAATAALAAAIGLGMGVLGGGGSIITVPALAFLLRIPPKDAVAMSLAIVAITAAAGALASFLRGVLPLTIAVAVGISATVGSVAGAAVGARLSDHTQLVILSMVMFGAALAMWWPQTIDQSSSPRRMPFLLAIGLIIGALTGLVGVGGGFLIAPALVVGARLPIARAAAASLFVIALSAVSALPAYAGRTEMSWAFIVPFALIAGVAAIAGGVVAPRLPQRRLRLAFAVSLVILASYVLKQA